MRIIPRAKWGAVHDDGAGPAPLPALGVRLHHSVTIAPDLIPPFDDDYAAIRTLERIGESRFGRGISYTFPITPAGLIFQGHSVDRLGSHTQGRNSTERAICFVGNYETTHPTEAQLDAAAWLLVHGWLSGWWVATALAGGHRDLKQTACPGQHAYDAMPEIDRRAKALADQLLNPEAPDMDATQNKMLTEVHTALIGSQSPMKVVLDFSRFVGPGFLRRIAAAVEADTGDVDEAEVARLVLAGIGDVALSSEQVQAIIDAMPDQVKRALREGTG